MPESAAPPSEEALDAFSRTVTRVAELASPAVLTIHPQRVNRADGTGSGLAFTPDGLILSNSHVVQGARRIRFATAVDTVRWVALQLLQHGRVRRGHLGIAAQTVTLPQQLRHHAELVQRTAVRVERAEPHGPAPRAGIEPGDLLFGFAGEAVEGIDDLHRLLSAERIGREWPLALLRRGRRLVLVATPAESAGD